MADDFLALISTDIDLRLWFNNRPPCVQAAILRCPPNRRYRMKATGPAWYAIRAYTEETDDDAGAVPSGCTTVMLDRFTPFGQYQVTVKDVPIGELIPVDESQPMAIGPAS